MGFHAGPISIQDANMVDKTRGRDWTMPDATDVRFLFVSGVIVIGDVQLYYEFTLVEYHLYIDQVLWVIFSNLNDALNQVLQKRTMGLPGRGMALRYRAI